ncbi:MAG: S41 family peptidase [Bacteroidales bacterium]|nr:S41 family peptidase [Bacteroidales bacterium]
MKSVRSLSGLVIGIFLCLTFIQRVEAQAVSKQVEAENKFSRALQVIRTYYVDTVNDEKMIESAIIAMLKDLDPHSTYMSKEEQKIANEPLLGSFEGIGVQFQISNDTILVISPTSGGPSERLGIMPGDRIVTIDGVDATGSTIDNNYVVSKLRGTKGTQVKVGIFRRNVPQIIEFTITRDRIPINSVDAVFMIKEGIGYIKLNRFARTTMQEFYDAFDKLQTEGMKNLILDLRGNSGGFLDVSVSLSDEFIPRGNLIVYTEGRSLAREEYIAVRRGRFEKGKLVVLIDEGSASASEIVSGAIQDWDRGLIIGRKSFGKALVQRPFELPDGSVIRLTTGKYYTPVGRHIQKPYDNGVEEYHKDLINRYNNGELTSADSIHFPDSLKYFTHGNRVVYGGGGIMPDIFVPLDTTKTTEYYTNLVRNGIFNQFALNYVDRNRDALNSTYSSFQDFNRRYVVDENTLEELYAFAEGKELARNIDQMNESKDLISLQLKALIARNLWDVQAYIYIFSEIDDALIKAIEVINDDTFGRLNITY